MTKFSLIVVYQLFNFPTTYNNIPKKGPLRTSRKCLSAIWEAFVFKIWYPLETFIKASGAVIRLKLT